MAVVLLAAVLVFSASLRTDLDGLYSHDTSAFLGQAGLIQPGQSKSEVLSLITKHDEVEAHDSMMTFVLRPDRRWTAHWGLPVLVNVLFIHVHFDGDGLVSRVERSDG